MKEKLIDSVLGKRTSYRQEYTTDDLVREERSKNRIHLGIRDDNLPFEGADVWHAYELSFLTSNGLPVNRVCKIVYTCRSKYIVESKSLKLYLNSFNMTPFGESTISACVIVESTISYDLSNLLETRVFVKLFDEDSIEKSPKVYSIFPLYIPDNTLKFDIFNEEPELIKFTNNRDKLFFHSNLLRSNCRVTNQPDWGDTYIYIKSNKNIDIPSLFQYLVSFRNEQHFHEEVCETIYKRLFDILTPEDLMVSTLYTRRGGIDINPCRASNIDLIDQNLIDHRILTQKTLRQ